MRLWKVIIKVIVCIIVYESDDSFYKFNIGEECNENYLER